MISWIEKRKVTETRTDFEDCTCSISGVDVDWALVKLFRKKKNRIDFFWFFKPGQALHSLNCPSRHCSPLSTWLRRADPAQSRLCQMASFSLLLKYKFIKHICTFILLLIFNYEKFRNLPNDSAHMSNAWWVSKRKPTASEGSIRSARIQHIWEVWIVSSKCSSNL